MSSNNRLYRYAFLGSVCLTALILFIFLLLNPANAPASVRGLDEWVRGHWTFFIGIIVGISISDFVLTVDRFQTETKKKLSTLEKELTELKSELRPRI